MTKGLELQYSIYSKLQPNSEQILMKYFAKNDIFTCEKRNFQRYSAEFQGRNAAAVSLAWEDQYWWNRRSVTRIETTDNTVKICDHHLTRSNSTNSTERSPASPQGFNLSTPWVSDTARSDGVFTLTEPWLFSPTCAAVFTLSKS